MIGAIDYTQSWIPLFTEVFTFLTLTLIDHTLEYLPENGNNRTWDAIRILKYWDFILHNTYKTNTNHWCIFNSSSGSTWWRNVPIYRVTITYILSVHCWKLSSQRKIHVPFTISLNYWWLKLCQVVRVHSIFSILANGERFHFIARENSLTHRRFDLEFNMMDNFLTHWFSTNAPNSWAFRCHVKLLPFVLTPVSLIA